MNAGNLPPYSSQHFPPPENSPQIKNQPVHEPTIKLNEDKLIQINSCELTDPLFLMMRQNNSATAEELYNRAKNRDFLTPVTKKTISLGYRFKNPKELEKETLFIDQKITQNGIYYEHGSSNPTKDETVLLELVKNEKQLLELINYWMALVRDPVRCFSYLKNCEEALKTDLQNLGFSIESEEPSFKYLMGGRCYFVPGPANPNRKKLPFDANDTIDSFLWKKMEIPLKINLEGSPVYVGGVDTLESNQFVASCHIPSEDPQIANLNLHGVYSHRLLFQILKESLKDHPKFKDFPPKQIPNLLICTRCSTLYGSKGTNLWVHLMDTGSDMYHAMGGDNSRETISLEEKNYSTSSRSPFIFNSLLLCFGSELGVPYLQRVLLEGFWSATDEMVERVAKMVGKQIEDQEIKDSLYLGTNAAHQCYSIFSVTDIAEGEVGTLSSEERINDAKYAQFPGQKSPFIKCHKSREQ